MTNKRLCQTVLKGRGAFRRPLLTALLNISQFFLQKVFSLSSKVYNFALVKQKSEVMSSLHHKATFAAQKNFSSAAFFMPIYLVNPNNCVTHTHTHTHRSETNIKVRVTRA